jgi:hypothetical protein
MLDIQAWKENMCVEAALICKSAWNCCPVLRQSKSTVYYHFRVESNNLYHEKIKFQSYGLENGFLVAKVKSTHMSYCVQTNTISMWTTYYAGLTIKT